MPPNSPGLNALITRYINVKKNCRFITTCVRPIIDTYKTAKIRSVTSRAVDIIKTVYYIYGPWRDRRNFCCFICVIIMGLTRCYKRQILKFIFAVFLLNFKDIQYRTKPVPALWNKRPPYWNNSTSLLSLTFHSSLESQFASAQGRNCITVSKSVKPRPRYGDFSQIFQDGGRRHLGFSKF